MHPTVRIVTFLVFAAFLSSGDPGVVAGAAALLGGAYLALRAPAFGRLLIVLGRLRFLWLSLAVLYFWFTPGAALWPSLGDGSPTREGVELGLVRIATLVLMTAAAHLLVQTARRAELIAGLEGLLRPFAVFGFDRERFAVRLYLVLEIVPRLAAERSREPPPARPRRLSGLVSRLERRLLDSVARAEQEPALELVIPVVGSPAWLQWLWPALLAAVLSGAGVLV